MRAEVFTVDGRGKQTSRGFIEVGDGHVVPSDDGSPLLRSLAHESIFVGGRKLLPADDPELFVRSLHLAYSGTYLRCGEAQS